jgi:hypothetical protein
MEELLKDEKIEYSKKGSKNKAEKKEQLSMHSPAGKSSHKKEISDSTSDTSPKEKSQLKGKESPKGTSSPKRKTLEKNGSIKEVSEKSPKVKTITVISSPKGKSHKNIEESGDKNKRKEEKEKQRKKNLIKFNKEFGKPIRIGTTLRRAESAPKLNQIQNGISLREKQTAEITKFPGSSRSQSTGKQKPTGQSLQKIVKLNILKDYKFAGKTKNNNKIII